MRGVFISYFFLVFFVGLLSLGYSTTIVQGTVVIIPLCGVGNNTYQTIPVAIPENLSGFREYLGRVEIIIPENTHEVTVVLHIDDASPDLKGFINKSITKTLE
ncbi:hypothetical protein PFDSM3638_07680 [Pyrococcus furiosus DSM 3638]|uniref:Uncharacterized protein n=3 Tax=Pyrococcus furiosus TaxID=2261 RepID=Q8U0Q9_PYRFU|nr:MULTISPECIES: hypothetical protein [Pyrococcus]AAL81649.1 hypothetical protein PF1525 [Pyrococcus furiosus DSM 3638]AFN04307.1 hypothetical protein PFC_06855 [Pyrococcus furiosus COM1]MDK2869029.1 hypothetical protein [Pyrococcus sp.]QEK79149.1 hypothetical protein PFDSM3638_07680 [Pyrococcus furiosus DSM 3638]